MRDMLDEDKTNQIAIFKDENGIITGLITYDTMYNDRWYLIHTSDDRDLLSMMIDHIISVDGDRAEIKVNSFDFVLNELVLSRGFHVNIHRRGLNFPRRLFVLPPLPPKSQAVIDIFASS